MSLLYQVPGTGRPYIGHRNSVATTGRGPYTSVPCTISHMALRPGTRYHVTRYCTLALRIIIWWPTAPGTTYRGHMQYQCFRTSGQHAANNNWWIEKRKTWMANKQSHFHHLTSYIDSMEQQMHAFCHLLNHYKVRLNGKSSCHLSWTK